MYEDALLYTHVNMYMKYAYIRIILCHLLTNRQTFRQADRYAKKNPDRYRDRWRWTGRHKVRLTDK